MENLDLKLINILINNRKELADFTSSAAEGIFEQEYKRFVKTLISYYNNYTSPPTLNTLLEFCGNNSNLKDYVSSIWEKADQNHTDPKEYSFILDKINKRYNMVVLTSVREKLNNIEDLEEANKFLYKATNEIKSIGESKTKIELTLASGASDYFQKFKAKQQNKELNEGVKSGFSVLDYHINGLRNGEFMIVAASSGGGKSIFMLNYCLNGWLGDNKFPQNKQELQYISENNLWKPGKNILFFSLEMPASEIQDRLISNMCSIDNRNLMIGDINLEQAEKMSLALNFYKKYPYQFKIVDIPRGCTIVDLQECLDETRKDFNVDFIALDYMSIMAGIDSNNDNDNDSDWLALLNLSKELFSFCRANNVPLISAMQLTAAQPGKDGQVGVGRIARSKGVISNTNFFLQIIDRQDEADRPDSQIVTLKARRGKLFKMSNLLKQFQYSRFVDQPISNKIMEQQQQTNLSEDDLSSSIDQIFGAGDIDI